MNTVSITRKTSRYSRASFRNGSLATSLLPGNPRLDVFARKSKLFFLAAFALFALGHSIHAQDGVEAFKAFVTNAPHLKSVRFWVHHTPARMGDSSRSNFYQLYDCVSTTNGFLVRYYQKENGLDLDMSVPDYVHLKKGPEYWDVVPNAVNYWYDDKSKTDEARHTLKGSNDADDRLLRLVFRMGITQERVEEFNWDGLRFNVTTEQSKIKGELLVQDGRPSQIQMTRSHKTTAQVDKYKIDYMSPTGAVASALPAGYTISKEVFKNWVPHTLVEILALETTLAPPDLSSYTPSNLLAGVYMVTSEVRTATFTNNSIQYYDSKTGFRTYTLPPPGGYPRPGWLKLIFGNRLAATILFAILLFLPLFFLLGKNRRGADSPEKKQEGERKDP